MYWGGLIPSVVVMLWGFRKGHNGVVWFFTGLPGLMVMIFVPNSTAAPKPIARKQRRIVSYVSFILWLLIGAGLTSAGYAGAAEANNHGMSSREAENAAAFFGNIRIVGEVYILVGLLGFIIVFNSPDQPSTAGKRPEGYDVPEEGIYGPSEADLQSEALPTKHSLSAAVATTKPKELSQTPKLAWIVWLIGIIIVFSMCSGSAIGSPQNKNAPILSVLDFAENALTANDRSTVSTVCKLSIIALALSLILGAMFMLWRSNFVIAALLRISQISLVLPLYYIISYHASVRWGLYGVYIGCLVVFAATVLRATAETEKVTEAEKVTKRLNAGGQNRDRSKNRKYDNIARR